MPRYTKKTVSVTQAIVTSRNCADVFNFVKQNNQLEEIEIHNAYTTSPQCRNSFFDKMWKHMTHYNTVKSISLHNTNCIPSQYPSARKNDGLSAESLKETSSTFCELWMPCMHWLHTKFAYNTSLCKLVLSDNGLRDREIAVICNVFQTNRIITHLDISNNQFGPEAIKNVCNIILGDTSTSVLKTLVIESNQLLDAGACLLATVLQTNTRLCILNVENNCIGPVGITRLADMLLHNTTLEMLSVAKNSSNRTAQQHLYHALPINKQLQSLDVSGLSDEDVSITETEDENGQSLQIVASAVDTVALLLACSSVQYVRLDNIHTDMALMRRIQEQLACHTVLQRISFVECGLTLTTVYELARGISANRSIIHVDLADNHLCEHFGMPHNEKVLGAPFWNLLARNHTLQVLCLRGNGLGTRSMWHAAEFVTQHTSLKVLDVSNNGIGSIGALVMLHALAKNKILRLLDLTHNAGFPMSYSRLLSAIIRKRICAQEGFDLHVRGIALFVSAREMRHFMASVSHQAMQITKHDLLERWIKDCQDRKVAFLLLTHPRLCTGLLTQLCIDSLRLILSYDTLHS